MNHADYTLGYFDDCDCGNCERLKERERTASDLDVIRAFWSRIRQKGQKDFYPDYYKLIKAEMKEMEERVNGGEGSGGIEAHPRSG